MTSPTDYTAWFCQEMKKLLDLIADRSHQTNPTSVDSQIAEIQRGIDYGINNPGSIDDLLLKLGRNFVDSFQVYLRQMKARTPTGVPPGGQATLLAGVGGTPQTESETSQQFSVDELKGALKSRKKEKVVKKMKGSLDLLKEYEES
ncbi:MAG: hypothetical protein JSW11_09850 [Candidatus Heimdallarchaeota archaeon]|nr:MAG: hypothetical protein JSW11_09850 [Candidatus Heimdallarchaeota archaeon]